MVIKWLILMESYKMKNKLLLGLLLFGSFSQNTIFAGEGAAAQEEQVECSICLEHTNEQGKAPTVRLRCACNRAHAYHANCIRRATQEQFKCPTCRANLSDFITEEEKQKFRELEEKIKQQDKQDRELIATMQRSLNEGLQFHNIVEIARPYAGIIALIGALLGVATYKILKQ